MKQFQTLLPGVDLFVEFGSLEPSNQSWAAASSSGSCRKTPVIDHFLSHDWNTSRYLKWMTLLVIFNAGPAACFTLLVSVVLSVFACFGYLGAEHLYWLPLPGFLTYVLVLLFWQDMRRAFRTPILAFDRVFVELVGHGGVFLPVALYVALGCMVHYFQLPQQLRHFRVQAFAALSRVEWSERTPSVDGTGAGTGRFLPFPPA
eukprot:g11838.t1